MSRDSLEKNKQQATMPSLPEEIQEEILLRLPVKSILCFKSVCKGWCRLVCNPKFVDDHLSLAKRNPRIMMRGANQEEAAGNGAMLYSVDYASIFSASASCEGDEGSVLMDNLVMKVHEVESGFINISGSCNGLLCLGAGHEVILWNPSTNEYKEILLPKGDFTITCYGFGYDSKINDYKLACMTPNEVHVYTLKSNSWRRFNTETHGYVRGESAGLLLNGVLHWSASSAPAENHNFIVSFDIISDKFMNMPFPEKIIQDNQTNQDSEVMLRVLGDSLCLVCGIRDVGVDIWVMQSYGVSESWVKKFTTNQVEITSNFPGLKFYWSIKNEEVLIQVPKGFVLFDGKHDRVRLLNSDSINGRFDYFESESYVESLVSLNSNTYTV